MKFNWELNYNDRQIISYCESKKYPITLKKELVGGNVYSIDIKGHIIDFKNEVNYVRGEAKKMLEMMEKQILRMQMIEEEL